MKHHEQEKLVQKLNDSVFFEEYKKKHDDYKTALLPLILGKLLVGSGNLIYGKEPSYKKFKAVEVIARIPYQSWEVASYTLLTLFYSNEAKAIELSKTSRFSRLAQDNETMHVVVISQIVKKAREGNFFIHTLIPLIFSFFYFWIGFLLYIFSPKSSFELNYLFENHALEQYSLFLEKNADKLRAAPVDSPYLKFYGREVSNEYDLFLSIRNDELIHRNESVEKIKKV